MKTMLFLSVCAVALVVLASTLGCYCEKKAEPAKVEIDSREKDKSLRVMVGDRDHPARRLWLEHVRARVSYRLQTEGFASVGKDKKPMSKEEAEKALALIDDETILKGSYETGAVTEGDLNGDAEGLLKRISGFIQLVEKAIHWVLTFLLKFFP